jgi:hypothetical protein
MLACVVCLQAGIKNPVDCVTFYNPKRTDREGSVEVTCSFNYLNYRLQLSAPSQYLVYASCSSSSVSLSAVEFAAMPAYAQGPAFVTLFTNASRYTTRISSLRLLSVASYSTVAAVVCHRKLALLSKHRAYKRTSVLRLLHL